jgi:hypothetical protein
MLKPGGIIISAIPKKGHWPGHCKFYFDETSFNSMNLDFESIKIQDINYESQGPLIYSEMKKIHDGEFKTVEHDLIRTIQVIGNYKDKIGY